MIAVKVWRMRVSAREGRDWLTRRVEMVGD